MDEESTWLRSRIERYRQVAKLVTDERAIKAIWQIIAEMEDRLRQITQRA